MTESRGLVTCSPIEGRPVPVLLLGLSAGPGGTGLQMLGMAKSLDRSQFEPHICVFRDSWNTREEIAALKLPILHLPVHSFKSWSVVSYARQLFSYLKRHRIVLTHCWDYSTSTFCFPVAKAAGVNVILISQRAHRALTPQPYRNISRILDRLVDGIVVNSQFMMNHMIYDEKAPPSRIYQCLNGIELDRFCAAPGPRPPILQDAKVVVGVVCMLRPEKNIQLLMRAFSKIQRSDLLVKLIIVGSGPEQTSLLQLRAALGLDESRCAFEPATKNVRYWLRGIDVFVLPSRSEASANSLIEAMACGCCVVASATGGNLEVIEHFQTGLLFRNDDVDSLVAELKTAVQDEQLRKRLGENASRFTRDRFSWETSARNMGEIYSKLLRHGGQ